MVEAQSKQLQLTKSSSGCSSCPANQKAKRSLLGVQQVLEEGVVVPGNGHLLVGLRVSETRCSARGAAKKPAKVGTLRTDEQIARSS